MIQAIMDTEYITDDLWLGLVEFGTETWYSGEDVNITLTARDYAMELDNGEDPASGDNSDGEGAAGALRVSLATAVATTILAVGALEW